MLSVEFLKERLSVKTLTGIFVSLVGSIIIIGKPWEGSLGSADELTGNLFIVMAVLSSVIGTIIFKPLIKKTSSYQATFMSLFFGIMPIALYALTQLSSWDVQATSSKSIWGLVLSTIIIIISNFLFFYALKRKKVQSTGVYSYVQPVSTIIAAWFILAERPSPTFTIGASLVFLGVYLAELHKANGKHSHHLKSLLTRRGH